MGVEDGGMETEKTHISTWAELGRSRRPALVTQVYTSITSFRKVAFQLLFDKSLAFSTFFGGLWHLKRRKGKIYPDRR
jgi:hypothetical protein